MLPALKFVHSLQNENPHVLSSEKYSCGRPDIRKDGLGTLLAHAARDMEVPVLYCVPSRLTSPSRRKTLACKITALRFSIQWKACCISLAYSGYVKGAGMAVNPKQGTLDSFVKKASSSPRAQRVQSGPIRHAAASKIGRHSPMSRPEGSSVEGVHTGSHTGNHEHTMPTQQSMATEAATSSSHPPSSATVSLKVASTSRKLQLSEVKGDLFSCPDSASLVHCVSEDLHMGKGIATLFKQKFGGVGG